MTAYYNEIEPFAADWLRNLIAGGHIAPGEVDERDIRDVMPADLAGFDQCHFFAGLGAWSLALRYAGVPDSAPVWTGSCPCQPFSAAGKGDGVLDERHLWPAWFHLIGQRRPAVVYGEQVASKAGLGWFDLVSADLEGAGYAVGANDLGAAGVGSPNIRQRLWFVGERLADAQHPERRAVGIDGQDGCDGPDGGRQEAHGEPGARGEVRGLADASSGRRKPREGHGGVCGSNDGAGTAAEQCSAGGPDGGLANAKRDGGGGRRSGTAGTTPGGMQGADGQWERLRADAGSSGAADDERLADAECNGQHRSGQAGPGRRCEPANGGIGNHRPGPPDGFWANPDWLFCRDGRWRPVEPGTFPLADGTPARVGKLRAYGNAINPRVAAEFIAAHIAAAPPW